MGDVIADVRYATRALGRHGAFTIAVTLTLAIGFAATVAVFSLYRAALLRPIDVAEPDRVVFVHRRDAKRGAYSSCSYPTFLDYRERLAQHVDVAAYQTYEGITLDRYGHVAGAYVTDGYFSIAGLPLLRGRAFTHADGAHAAVISERLWTSAFARDEAAVGQAITVQNTTFVIVGVAPQAFAGFDRDVAPALWLPLEANDTFEEATHQRGRDWLEVVGRLRPGVTRDAAEAVLQNATAPLAAQYPSTEAAYKPILTAGTQGNIHPLHREQTARLLSLVGAAVALLVLVTCATAANLAVARIQSRTREFQIRVAVGAERARLIRLVAMEHGLLAMGAAAIGSLLAVWLRATFGAYAFPGFARIAELPIPIDATQIGTTALLVFVVGCGLTLLALPRFRAHSAVRIDSGRATHRLLVRRALVSLQVGLSLPLLFGAGLLFKALYGQIQLDAAFRSRPILMATVTLPRQIRATPDAGENIYQAIRQRVAQHPGVTSASWCFTVPYGFLRMQASLTPLGSAGGTVPPGFNSNVVDSEYFRLLGIPVLRGRSFTETDREGSERVVIVTEALAKRYWPGRDPIGQRFAGRAPGTSWTIVGIAPDGLHYDIRNLRAGQREFVYYPLAQMYQSSMTLLIASESANAATLADRVRTIVQEETHGIDPVMITSRRYVDAALSQEWLSLKIGGIIAAIALALAGLGLYGIVRYTVAQRTREIGIRIALGATPRTIVRLAIQDVALTVTPGVLLGMAALLPLAVAIRPLLHDVRPYDPAMLAAAIGITVACVTVALWRPARDASRIEPADALRSE